MKFGEMLEILKPQIGELIGTGLDGDFGSLVVTAKNRDGAPVSCMVVIVPMDNPNIEKTELKRGPK